MKLGDVFSWQLNVRGHFYHVAFVWLKSFKYFSRYIRISGTLGVGVVCPDLAGLITTCLDWIQLVQCQVRKGFFEIQITTFDGSGNSYYIQIMISDSNDNNCQIKLGEAFLNLDFGSKFMLGQNFPNLDKDSTYNALKFRQGLLKNDQ